MKAFRLIALWIVLALALVPPDSAHAQQDDRTVAWERFDVAIDLLPDGTLRVVHTETIRFDGAFTRAYREIPLARLSSITEVQVGEPGRAYREGFGESNTFNVTRGDDRLRIDWWFPRTANTTRTFELRYRVSGAIRVYEGGDQVYWVAVPADRPGPVRASEIVVRFPADVPTEQLRAESYEAGRPRPAASVGPREVRFTADDLEPGRDFEVRVQFPHGLVAAKAPPWQAEYDRQAAYDAAVRPILNLLLLLATLAILVGGPLLLFLRWYARGRDPALGGKEPLAIDQPPSDLPPGLVGTLVDEQADLQDVLATLVDLGNRGVIRITEVRDPSLQGSTLDYSLELLQKQPLGLRGYERTVIGALFGSADQVRLSQVKGRWASYIPLFQDQLYREAVGARLFEDNPDLVRKRARSRAMLLLVGGVLGGFVAQSMFGGLADLIMLPFLALAVLGAVMLATAARMPRRTKAGVVEAARWRAFANHLATARRQPRDIRAEQFTRYLPYAVALGVDRTWLDNFAAIGSPAPRWYGGSGPVIIGGPGGWGFPGAGPTPYGGPWGNGGARRGGETGRADSGGGFDEWSGGLSGGLGSASGSLSDLLNAASEALSSGGGGGWSGGGGGGSFGGGGGSGGGSAGFG